MSLRIHDYDVRRVCLIDDSVKARAGQRYPIEELELEVVDEVGPIYNEEDFYKKVSAVADAAIFDHQLKVNEYSRFNGAELVAYLYQRGFPAILCTRYEERLVEDIRGRRQFIPALVNPGDLTPDTVVRSLTTCIEELHGKVLPSRRAWRTLIRIGDVDRDLNKDNPFVDVFVPAWDGNRAVRLMMKDIPLNATERIVPGYRCFAHVNTGAEKIEDLFFAKWEFV